MHGGKRGGEKPGQAFFESLPEDDPHHMLSKAEKRAIANARKREETRIRNEKIMAAYAKLYSK